MPARRPQWTPQQIRKRCEVRGRRQGKLTFALARQIRAEAPRTLAELDATAKRYGLGRRTVQDVMAGRSWREPSITQLIATKESAL